MIASRGTHPGHVDDRVRAILVTVELVARELFRLELVGRDDRRLGLHRQAQRVRLRYRAMSRPRRACVPSRISSAPLPIRPRYRAAGCPRTRRSSRPWRGKSNLSRNCSSSFDDTERPAVDLSVLAGGRIEHRECSFATPRECARSRSGSIPRSAPRRCGCPLAPPASPVDDHRLAEALDRPGDVAHPCPPASSFWSTVRWRRPRVKLGTSSVLSRAALRVTVDDHKLGSPSRGGARKSPLAGLAPRLTFGAPASFALDGGRWLGGR